MKLVKLIAISIVFTLSACHVKKYNPQIAAKSANAKEILLLGTFHYNNPGSDAVKNSVFDVMTEDGQKQLASLANKIKKYHPSKIFVEWDVDDQANLDLLYQKYLDDIYFNDKTLNDFYLKNEIFQLAFRAAKKLNHKKVYAVDYMHTNFDFPSIMQAIDENNQAHLNEEIQATIKAMGEETSLRMSSMTLEDLYLYSNQPSEVIANIELYTQLIIKAGNLKNTSGAETVAQWYKRNLFIWSNIQKIVTKDDHKIMVLLGGGHTAIIDQIISRNNHWKIADLKKILTNYYVEVEF